MLSLLPSSKIFLVAGPTDMRRSFNGLAAIVENEVQGNPLSGQVFVFCNRRRDRVKLLWWDGSGLWVAAKRLERGTFAWPEIGTPSVEMGPHQVSLLLGGIDLKETRPRRWYRRAAEG